MKTPYKLEKMCDAHGPSIMRILNHYVTEDFSAFFDTVLPETFFTRLRETADGYPSVVALNEENEIVGFGLLRPYHPAHTFRRTSELSYFISPEHTRKGIGGMILNTLIQEASQLGIDRLLASISSLNPASLAFHTKNSFEEVGRLKGIGCKFGRDFDIVYMQRILTNNNGR